MIILLAFQVAAASGVEGVRLSVDGSLGWAKAARSDDIWMEVGALALLSLQPKRESIRLLLVGIYSPSGWQQVQSILPESYSLGLVNVSNKVWENAGIA